MNRRSGITLVEVLVAIFVMGVGLLALLTLFPIGILTMAQAIRDDRASQAAVSANAIAQAKQLRYEPTFNAKFTNPNPLDPLLNNAPPDGPSWAIYVDPNGFRSYADVNFAAWVGGKPLGIQRRSPDFVENPPPPLTPRYQVLRWFTAPDDLIFDLEGKAEVIGTDFMGRPRIKRESIYSWAYLLRRPMNGQPSVVEMSVVVYSDRLLTLNNLNQQPRENVFGWTSVPASGAIAPNPNDQAVFDPGRNVITVSWDPAAAPPEVSLGSWILDNTPVQATAGPPKYGPSHARFYRVVGITQTAANVVELEVQQPILGFPLPPPTPAALRFHGTIVVMEGVAEVYEVGTGWEP